MVTMTQDQLFLIKGQQPILFKRMILIILETNPGNYGEEYK